MLCPLARIINFAPNDKFFEKLFMAICIYFQSFCQKSAKRIAEEILFVFCFDVWPGAPNLALRTQPTRLQSVGLQYNFC